MRVRGERAPLIMSIWPLAALRAGLLAGLLACKGAREQPMARDAAAATGTSIRVVGDSVGDSKSRTLAPAPGLITGGVTSERTGLPGLPGLSGLSEREPSEWERAEDARNAAAIAPDIFSSTELHKQRGAARALARIADDRAAETLARGIHSNDLETLRWVGYGLGYSCKNREDAHVKQLAARVLTLVVEGPASPAHAETVMILQRAMARCGTALAEAALAHWLMDPALRDGAALALGDFAARKKQLSRPTLTALLDVVDGQAAPLYAAGYPLSRVQVPADLATRVGTAAQRLLDRPGELRIFAIRALSHGDERMPKVLAEIVSSQAFTPEERVEAVRALAAFGAFGSAEAGALLPKLLPGKDAFAIGSLGGPLFGIIKGLLELVTLDPPKAIEPQLFVIAALVAPAAPGASAASAALPAGLRRRLGMLRCEAAQALAHGAYDSAILADCDEPGSASWARGRLTALLRRPLQGARLQAWSELVRSPHVRVAESALEAFGAHPELGEVGQLELVRALEGSQMGLLTTAAELLFRHPDRGYPAARTSATSAAAAEAAVSQRVPHAVASVALAPVGVALSAALAKKMPEDLIETRALLLDAAVALRLPAAHAAAKLACADPNVTIRQRAELSLRTLGEKEQKCRNPSPQDPRPGQLEKVRAQEIVKLRVLTDAGELSLRLLPEAAPVTVARIAGLVNSGFYNGMVFHRVVPGFVAQFGDRGGDGYGGSGAWLNCETSPLPFHALNIGMALAGRDTGSSQLFVTLSRTPHLDGEYTWLGTATGDWSAVAEGDVIQEARVVP